MRTKVVSFFKARGWMLAFMAALVAVALIAPTGFAGAQATPVDPTLANIKTDIQAVGLWTYITAGLYIFLVLVVGFALLRKKRA